MKFLVIGLGSMGKRRIRNLLELGHTEIAGFDIRTDRVIAAQDLFDIVPFSDINKALITFQPDVLIISTAPQSHMEYAFLGLNNRIPCFIEASVVGNEQILELDAQAKESGVLMAPSCTLRFYFGPQIVKQLLGEGVIGEPLIFTYHTGQWLEDWHPWERISDFYVSQRESGGCREIVPFELTWINDIFGDPSPLSCVRSKVSSLNADIDDVYYFVLRYPSGLLANITIEVLSRPNAVREMRIVGDKGTIVYSADQNVVKYANTAERQWTEIPIEIGVVEEGYINPEGPYVSEMASFISAVQLEDPNIFPNSLAEDYSVLQILNELEAIADRS